MIATIYKDGVKINRIVADESFCETYCAENGYTYTLEPDPAPVPEPAPEPTETEQLRADLDKLAAAYIEGVNEA